MQIYLQLCGAAISDDLFLSQHFDNPFQRICKIGSLLQCIVRRERSTDHSCYTITVHQRFGTHLAGAYCNTQFIEHLRNIRRVTPLDAEREKRYFIPGCTVQCKPLYFTQGIRKICKNSFSINARNCFIYYDPLFAFRANA